MPLETPVTDSRIVALAGAARNCRAQALKIDERHPMIGGAHLRLWFEQLNQAEAFVNDARHLGYEVPLCAPHLVLPGDTSYHGWQVNVIVPAADYEGLARQLAPGSAEIGP